MRDTAAVFDQLDLTASQTKILAIVANTRGADEACRHPAVSYVGFPLSLSETFQQRNTNKSIPQALDTLNEIQDLCTQSGRTLVTYLSMGFGNPYGDPYDADVVSQFTDILHTLQVRIISLADTIGVATPEQITALFGRLVTDFPDVEFGAHLHSQPASAREKVDAALRAGCRRFDGAILGFGGCPMAKDDLVGNVATETILQCLADGGTPAPLNMAEFSKSIAMAKPIFGIH
jgi:hydroxymethylglutaryl-CoA lyase